MASGCRDCARCTEIGLKSLLMLPWRLTFGLVGRFTIGLFQRHCPQCGHRMNVHRMVKPGEARFAD